MTLVAEIDERVTLASADEATKLREASVNASASSFLM
jgi:hypothetical protein